jgi:drug/metabolite transporter (DMT)-like permease
MNKKSFSSADLLLICVVMIWGSNYTFGKIALREFSPTSFAALRTMLSAPILLLVLSIREKGLHITKGDILPFALLGLLGHCLNRLCWSYGLTLTTASNASLLLAITPIHVALLATLFGIERVHRKSAVGIAVALLGVFFVLKADLVNVRFGKATLVGDVFMLGTGVLWALFTIYAKHLLQNHSILKLTAWSAQFGAAFMIPFALRSLIQGELAGISLKAWGCLLVVSFLGNALSHLFWITGIFKIGPTKTTVYQTLVPLVAIFIAVMVLGESLALAQMVGAALILGGVYLTRIG